MTPLAIHGGPPAFAEPLHVGRPNIGDRTAYLRRVNEMLDRKWLTNDGPLVREFERRVADVVGAAHCVAVCNATVGLELAIRGLGLSGEVIVPSYTFIATAHALRWQQITPVFADIDPVTHNLDPARVEAAITPRTTAIIGVHLWGRPAAVESLADVAERHGLTLMFDAAHGFGCSHRGRMIGGFGRCEVFSFHATKFVNAGEGGAIVTDDGAFADRLRTMRNFGFVGYDTVAHIGTNGKMSEAAAALGLTNLESVGVFVETNRRNHEAYAEALAGISGLHVMPYDAVERHNYQYVVVEVDAERYGLSRDEAVSVLHAENVLARRYFYPGCHRMEPYRSERRRAAAPLPQTERMAGRVVLLPTGMAVGRAAIETIGRILGAAHGEAPAVRAALRREAVAAGR